MPTIHELHTDLVGPRWEYGNIVYRYHTGLQENGVELNNLETCPYITSSDRFFWSSDDICLKDVPPIIKSKALPLAAWNVDFRKKYPFDHDVVLTTPEQVEKAIADLETAISTGKLKAGDILDIEGYRGTGYYFIYEDNAGELQLQATEGEYGIILPKEAYRYVRKFGVMTYATLSSDLHTGVPGSWAYLSGCCIPLDIAQINHKRLEKMKIPLESALLVWYPARGGGGYEKIYNVDFAGEHILDGLLCEMTDDIYFDIQEVYAKAV